MTQLDLDVFVEAHPDAGQAIAWIKDPASAGVQVSLPAGPPSAARLDLIAVALSATAGALRIAAADAPPADGPNADALAEAHAALAALIQDPPARPDTNEPPSHPEGYEGLGTLDAVCEEIARLERDPIFPCRSRDTLPAWQAELASWKSLCEHVSDCETLDDMQERMRAIDTYLRSLDDKKKERAQLQSRVDALQRELAQEQRAPAGCAGCERRIAAAQEELRTMEGRLGKVDKALSKAADTRASFDEEREALIETIPLRERYEREVGRMDAERDAWVRAEEEWAQEDARRERLRMLYAARNAMAWGAYHAWQASVQEATRRVESLAPLALAEAVGRAMAEADAARCARANAIEARATEVRAAADVLRGYDFDAWVGRQAFAARCTAASAALEGIARIHPMETAAGCVPLVEIAGVLYPMDRSLPDHVAARVWPAWDCCAGHAPASAPAAPAAEPAATATEPPAPATDDTGAPTKPAAKPRAPRSRKAAA